ncbi:helix-turn-helix domain-containing protein [Paenibacillus sp. N3.4]|uniref:helix-turn-helix domain-containing protein n=1 Tax=Paenibacillus sp. N3.4 TaxID=2603222 RepID=UPI0011C7FA4A|nr:helix-turn-helix transcriptional regulator [Paenibacillus sp. N3.4]TXK71835.1 helix-turn-helix transcriptional regulator [Paenibacillus sp. N3.4]
MSILKDFGVRLKELRIRSGMSQDMLANHSNLDRTYIGGVERGERNVSLKNIEILCNTLDVDISYFFDDERFSLHTAFLKSEFSRPLKERFSYIVNHHEQMLHWEVKGVLSQDEVLGISAELKQACLTLISGKVKLLVDNRLMIANGQPIVFTPEVMGLWEDLQRWLTPQCSQVIVLCNSKLMKNQMDRLAKRSGLIKVQSNLYAEDKEWLLHEAFRLLRS